MDLHPLYDVKERLEKAAIAGVGLLGEDFRLKRAAEGLKPLAAASPVFARIDQGLQRLLAVSPEERGGELLDALALVNAVLYTQGTAGTSVGADAPTKGDFVPLSSKKGTYQQLSYNQLHPLLEDLAGIGGGRMNRIQQTWKDHKEFFSDYRVLPKVIAGLGESYVELADLYCNILKGQGCSVVPWLKEGFDPAGKRDMARRVQVISAIEGAKATPWLLEILPRSQKDIRVAVILALGEDPANTPLLLDLAKRGGNRETVLAALAKQDGEAVQAFWKAETADKPQSMKHLQLSSTEWAANLAAAAFQKQLEAILAKKESADYIDVLKLEPSRQALLGKSSPAALDCWRWVDDNLNNSVKMKHASGQVFNLSGQAADWLMDGLCKAGPSPLSELCLELWEKRKGQTRYLCHGAIAALLTHPAAEAYEMFASHARHTNRVRDIFSYVSWNQEERVYEISNFGSDKQIHCFPIAEPLDPRWLDMLFQMSDMEYTLAQLIPPDNQELLEKLRMYRLNEIARRKKFITQGDVAHLREGGWTQWKGFLDKFVRRDRSLSARAVARMLNETTLTGPEKAAELRSLEKIVQEQHAANQRPLWPEQVMKELTAAWEAE